MVHQQPRAPRIGAGESPAIANAVEDLSCVPKRKTIGGANRSGYQAFHFSRFKGQQGNNPKDYWNESKALWLELSQEEQDTWELECVETRELLRIDRRLEAIAANGGEPAASSIVSSAAPVAHSASEDASRPIADARLPSAEDFNDALP